MTKSALRRAAAPARSSRRSRRARRSRSRGRRPTRPSGPGVVTPRRSRPSARQKADVDGHQGDRLPRSRRTSTQIKKQYFGGSEKQVPGAAQAAGLTDAQVRERRSARSSSPRSVLTKMTKDVKVSDARRPHLLRRTPVSSTSRPSRATSATSSSGRTSRLAQSVYRQLKSGTTRRGARSRRSTRRIRLEGLRQGDVLEGPDGPRFRHDRVLGARRRRWRSRSTTRRSTAGS